MRLLETFPRVFTMVKKNPEMDPHFAIAGIPPLKLLCTQISLAERRRAEEFRFIKRPLLEENCPDFHGFNTDEARIAGQAPKPISKVTLGSLLTKLRLNLQQCLLQW